MEYGNDIIILSSKDDSEKKLWEILIKKHFNEEPMMMPSYLELFTDVKDKCYFAVMNRDRGIIGYPFIVREIPDNDGLYDTTTPYGYGGPILIGELNENDKNIFWDYLKDWFKKENIISEFIRFALYNTNNTGYIGERNVSSLNVVRKLDMPLEDIWYDFEHKVRKNIKKATKSNLTVEFDLSGDRIEEFLSIYYSTMDRREANKTYYFEREFFECINKNLRGNFAYFYVMHEGRCISTELVLYSKKNIYSYLGGTLSDYFEYRPNDLLKYEIIKWGNKNNISNFVLGGGYECEDGIFKYKKSFAPNGIINFYVGKGIYNNSIYNYLCKSSLFTKRDGFFPEYRR